MVKEVTAYKHETTGKIFKTFEEAQKSEEKAKRLTEEKEIQNFANDLAKRYGYSSWTGLIFYLNNNIDKIKNAGVKIRVIELQKRLTSFPLTEVQNHLENIITKALADVKDESVIVNIIVDSKTVKSYEIKEYEFDETKVTFKEFNPQKYYFNKTAKHVDGLTKADIYRNLSNGGVDNWGGYDYAIELAEEDEKEWYLLTPEEKLSYLYAAGVDNWGYYYESKSSGFDYDNLNETLQYEYFKDNEDLLAEKWENYTKFKKELYDL